MPQEHTSKQFDVELQAIRSHVLQMGGLVEEQLVNALEALTTGNLELADTVMANEERVNRFELGIDEMSCHLIVRRQPTASDLRFTMMILKIITDLERIGDEAAKLARMTKRVYESDTLCLPRFSEILGIGRLVTDMLRTTLNSFARLEPDIVIQISRQDDQVDEVFRAKLRQFIACMMEDPRTITVAIEILFAAKSLERIGDHVKNLSEYLVYMVKGKDIRHSSIDKIEQELQEPARHQ